ncbi:histidine phosphatase family protein [Aspergillus lucknowensis]|uniref:Histidine phosphatase superfamily n=1 Tax=Aspergillus lucknowensis TaxID=176173 RepID=A0ABR4LTT5_9EURO
MRSVYEGILDMLTFFLSLFFTGVSLAAVDSFYPPLNHTTYITNASLGSYGGVFSAPSDQASPPPSEIVYNYCSMPHPHVDTYSLPQPVANHSVSAKLVYLEYLQRHQRRTPYNILPGGENQEYNCDNIHPHLFAAPATGGPPPLQVYAQTYTDPTNPFLTHYVNGSCQYPQLTIGGYLDGFQHGRDLRAVYGAKLGLIPETLHENDKRVWFRSSSSPLTQGSAGGVLRGLWPEYKGPLPLHQQASSVDTVNRGFPCAARDTTLDAIQSSPEWDEYIQVTAQLRDHLADLFDARDSADWLETWDHFADNFQARLCNGYNLPCRLGDESQCVSKEQAFTVFRAGDWMYNYWWRGNANVTEYIQVIEGMFIAEIARKFEAVRERRSDIVYSHNFVHDGDIAPLLGALGIRALRWPGMAANIAFEIWETSAGGFYARVLYSGRAIETIHGTLEWIPLTKLIDILSVYIPEDIFALCG